MITEQEIKKLADMSRVYLKDDEISKFQSALSSILDYVDELKEVDTENLEIVSSVTGLENIVRTDEPIISENSKILLDNSPASKDGYFKVKANLINLWGNLESLNLLELRNSLDQKNSHQLN